MEIDYKEPRKNRKWNITIRRLLEQSQDVEIVAESETEALMKLKEMSQQYNTTKFWEGNTLFDDWWVEDQELFPHPLENGPTSVEEIIFESEEEDEDGPNVYKIEI
tara:strand:- start:455 stop:772 length:318 start_codon:yes stop_codon:yes gene_type:complete